MRRWTVQVAVLALALAGAWCAGCGGGSGSSSTAAQPAAAATTAATAAGAATTTTTATRTATTTASTTTTSGASAGGKAASGQAANPAKPGTTTGLVDPCALVTRQDASVALGASPSKGDGAKGGSGAAAMRSCVYDDGPESVSVEVRRESSSGFDRKQIQQSAAGRGKRPLAGVGDAAFLQLFAVQPSDQTATALVSFVEAHAYVTLMLTLAKKRMAARTHAMTALARAAAGRL
jgi:hypothetical protein